MKIIKDEQYILNLIKYGPILFVLIFSFLFTQFFLYEKNEDFKKEIKQIENSYLENNKLKVKEKITEVYNLIKEEKENSEKLLKENIKDRVYEAHELATNIYKHELVDIDDGHTHSSEHIFKTIKHALGGITYNKGRGYFFMINVDGIPLLQPFNKQFEVKNYLELEDEKGYKFVKKIANTIKNKTESYDSYYWLKSNDRENAYKKISFYKYFEPYNVVIGTGEYVKDFENELKEKLLKRIRKMRFDKDGYIFIFDLEGNSLSHYKKELIGINRINYQDINGNFLIKDIINFGKVNSEGFMSYFASSKPKTINKNSEKISYIKLFEDWGWVIGTGFYLDDLTVQIEKKKELLKQSNNKSVQKIIVSSILITLFFILISFYVSKIIKERFDKYKKELEIEISNTIEKEKMLVQQSKMATMGEMIGNIAHQWKQPLSLISTSNGLLKLNREFNNTFEEKDIDNAITSIDDSVKNLATTIDDFRNFFNPNKEEEYFYIRHTFDKTFKLISSQLKNNSIEIIQNIEEVQLYGLENELLQVLINILKNAKEELVKNENINRKVIIIDVYNKNSNLEIKITDNAGGIPFEIIDKIFDSHFTTKAESGGTGIGLYMSKQIIEKNMQGQLTAKNCTFDFENETFTGAQFKIVLSLKQ